MASTRLTTTGSAFGTPGYLAPEQALGDQATGAADVFALGAVLVTTAGGSAWGEGTAMGLMYRSVHEPPDLSVMPAGLRGTVAACLAKDPAARPTPTRLLDLLTGAPQDPVPTAYTPTMPLPPRPPAPSLSPPSPAPQPELVISDREAGIVVDGAGITLEINGVEADFDWPEIAAVRPSPRGNRLMVTVQLHDGAVYPCELHARRAARLAEWIDQLHHVVGRYFVR